MAGAAGPVGSRRGEATDDIALAVPRVSLSGNGSHVALPQPLAPSDAERIRRVFALQARNDIPAAIAAGEAVSDALLLPHILADRYLGGANRARPEELAAWLARWADLPDAPAIHALLTKAAPKLARGIAVPEPLAPLPMPVSGDELEPQERLLERRPGFDRAVHELARTSAERAVALVARVRGLDRLYAAQLRAEVAQILFAQGEDRRAFEIARAADEQAGGQVGLAPFVAGLAAWRMGQADVASAQFERAFRARLMQPGRRAAAAFWEARSARRLGDEPRYGMWLRRAGENGRTFYGLLARHMMGQSLALERDVDRAVLGEADLEAVAAAPAGRRAFALIQVGQSQRAAAELHALWAATRDQPGMAGSIMLVARAAGLVMLADQLESMLEPAPVRMPVRRLRPRGGFQTDPALLYAIARMESNWNPGAVSRAGARGLMQLMPVTVDFLAGTGYRERMHDPAVSLDIGQRYLMLVAQYDLVGGDLIRLLAGYNSGPAGLGKWIGSMRDGGDPLMFIESVPNDETRQYIPRALAYTWLYAAEMKLPSPSLDALAQGSWPRFAGTAATPSDQP